MGIILIDYKIANVVSMPAAPLAKIIVMFPDGRSVQGLVFKKMCTKGMSRSLVAALKMRNSTTVAPYSSAFLNDVWIKQLHRANAVMQIIANTRFWVS